MQEIDFDLSELRPWGLRYDELKGFRDQNVNIQVMRLPNTCPVCERYSLGYVLSETPIVDIKETELQPIPDSRRFQKELSWYSNAVGFVPADPFYVFDEHSTVGTVTMICPICSRNGRVYEDRVDVDVKFFLARITADELGGYLDHCPHWPEEAKPHSRRENIASAAKIAALRSYAENSLHMEHRHMSDKEFCEYFAKHHVRLTSQSAA